MPLTKEMILAANDTGIIRVEVKEWPDADGKPGVVGIRVLTVGDRDAYENDWVLNKSKGVENFRTKFLAKCLCNPETGERLFNDEEVSLLSKKSAKVMGRLWEQAMKHNALTEADVDELAKN
jgi:hypothetical protein